MSGFVTESVEVEGATIAWGERGHGPDLVLVHGNGANHAWWDPVGDLLADDYRLILLDLSGHGDSGHRVTYSPALWIQEVRAVVAAAGARQPVMVGHSMGGRVVLTLAANHPDDLPGLVLLDTSIRPTHRYREFPRVDRTANRVYADREEAIARFRLLPPQPHPDQALVDRLAVRSLEEAPGGWTWKYDPQALLRFRDRDVDAAAQRLERPLAFVYASESSVVDEEIARYVERTVQGGVTVTRVDDAHHHVVLDQPEECARLIDEAARKFLADEY